MADESEAKDLQMIETVMARLEEFWMSDDENSGEAIFNKFAAEHANLFEGDYADAEHNDNKLEYTNVHKKF